MAERAAEVLFLMGPTGGGKTDLAVSLGVRLPVDLISVDSAMVYRGLDIGTAKPTPEVQKFAPHRLIDICDPTESYSAGRFREDAAHEIEDVLGRGRIPLLVGGTGLYFRALEQGLSRLPPADPKLRAALLDRARAEGWPAMHRWLAEVDPEAAARIHPNDPQRIQRALEVHELTGRSMSSLLRAGRAGRPGWVVRKIILAFADRARNHEQVQRRFRAMLDRGFMDEMMALYSRGDLNPQLPSMRLVGYRQGWQHLAGAISYDDMISRATAATRQLVKRQLTWLRREAEAEWFDAGQSGIESKVLQFMEQATNFKVGVLYT